MANTYALSGFREGPAGIEAVITLEGEAVTVITGITPYDLTPARNWATHGTFLTWAEREHGSVEEAVQVLIESRQRT